MLISSKSTVGESDLRSKNKLAVTVAFLLGYLLSDVLNQNGTNPLVSQANAAVLSSNWRVLVKDKDFRIAVMRVAEEECQTDIHRRTFKTWFYCGENSRYAPRY